MLEWIKRYKLSPACGAEPTRLFECAIAVWIVFSIAAGVKVLLWPLEHNSYVVYEEGAHLWLADLDIYAKADFSFRYGPTFAMAIAPLTFLPTSLASVVWVWFTLAAFFWSLRTLVREILPGPWTANREAIFLILALGTSYRGIWSAQCNVVIFACVVAGAQALLRKQWGWAGVWLAIPVHIKVWPIAAALLLMACWPRRLIARFIGGLMAVALLPCVVKWPSVVIDQYRSWFAVLSGPAQSRHTYRDAWSIWELVQQPVNESAYLLLQLSLALLVLLLCLAQKRRGVSTAQLLTFILALWTAWQLFVGPATERNTFGLIAPMTAWALLTAISHRRGAPLMIVAYALTLAGSIGQIERTIAPQFSWVVAAHPLGVLLFASWIVWYARDWAPGAAARQPTSFEAGLPAFKYAQAG